MKTLTTVFALAIFLGTIPQSLRADEAEARGGAFVPTAAAAVLPIGHLTIDQLSSNDFVTTQPTAEQSSSSNAKWHRQWAISLVPLFASQALDSASSSGMRELNPLLASPDGGFGLKATTIKFGVVGALAATEYYVVRKYPRSAKVFTIVNWTTAGATSALAIHNFSIR